ncbi:unnamed protein product [Clonostachys rosea]|uniref:D-xylose 1-dehydrogenase (NADP(+), D-xylono-1,5-lactone-forming) n=1 Tax=Bionectria ochroleuca TaxID=29856 RepID=A0ABY6UMV8_BIOOC|nr:unnamed protein product [Clonostachys rosea]
MATGWIAEHFSKDLLADPAVRGAHDVRHEIVAVASSTSAERAATFIKKIDGPPSAAAYGSYQELVADPNVDIIHIGTPHSHHFQNAMLAIEAGKNVLCEKPLTVTASQTRKLVEAARSKGVFFLEAVWTRYFPISIKVRELIQSGAIGTPYRTYADLSLGKDLGNGKIDFEDSHRLVSLDLAGGCILDLGVYALTWVFQTLYHLQEGDKKEAPTVVAAVNKYHTGADEMSTIICQFPKHKSMGIATTTLRLPSDIDGRHSNGPSVRIQGSKGEIHLFGHAYAPHEYRLIKSDGSTERVEYPIPKDPKRGGWGHGMFWEADECVRCLRDGRKESAILPWAESIAIMEVMDAALKQGDVEYPELITSDTFDSNGHLNTGRK